jgi:hypothetical protein
MIGLRRRSRSGASASARDHAPATPLLAVPTLSVPAPVPAPVPASTPEPPPIPMRPTRAQSRGATRSSDMEQFGRQRYLGSVQQSYVSAEAVIGDVLVLAAQTSTRTQHTRRNAPASAHEYRALLEVSSVNYALKTEGEQEAILAGYRAFLNSLTFPLQILVQVRPLDLAPYIAQFQTAQEAFAARDGISGGEDATRDHVAAKRTIWVRLAEDEARYVLDLAARKTLLERRFFLVIPADGQAALESSAASGSGLRVSGPMLSLPALLPLPGRRRRRHAAAARAFQSASKALDLRTHAVSRELERLGLEARRLAGSELVAVYHRAIAPNAFERHPLSEDVLAGVGLSPVAPGPCSLSPVADEANGADAAADMARAGQSAHQRDISERITTTSPDRRRMPGTPGSEEVQGSWGDLADLLAPAGISLTRNEVRLDDTCCRTLAVVGYPRHVYAGWLERLIDLDEPFDVVLHLHPQSTAAMIRQLSHRLVQLHSSRLLNEERSRIGHAELGVAYRDVEQMREKLQRGDERVFAASLYLHVRAPVAARGPARQPLEERVARVEQELANQQLVARPATFEQDLALLSCLPEGRDRLMRTRLLDTSSLATAFPFLSNSLSMPGGILYGMAANGSPVFIDVFSPLLENANKVIFAKSGAGKSYGCKIEALRSLLRGVDVYVIDPEAEYGALAAAVGGQTVRLAAGAEQHLNPFDLPASLSERLQTFPQATQPAPAAVLTEGGKGDKGEAIAERHLPNREAGDLLADKVQSLHALLDLMLADRGPTGTAGLSQREKGLLDRALYEVYRRAGISSDPATHMRPAPLLRDLYDVLVGGACGADDTHLAERLHRYVHGSLSRLFAEPTNVELTNRLVVFDVRDMDAELRPLGLFLIADFVWTRVRHERRPRLLIIDKAWTLMQYQEGGRFLAGLARRARKYYLGLVTITQDAQDFLSSEHGRTVLANSSVQLLMKQDSSTIEAVTKAFRLSTGERQYLLGCHKGEGLLFARGGHVALQIGASPFEHELATTDPRELAARQASGAGAVLAAVSTPSGAGTAAHGGAEGARGAGEHAGARTRMDPGRGHGGHEDGEEALR